MNHDREAISRGRAYRPSRVLNLDLEVAIETGGAPPAARPQHLRLPPPRPERLPPAAGPAPAMALLAAWRGAWEKGMVLTARAAVWELRKLAERPERGGDGNTTAQSRCPGVPGSRGVPVH